MAGMKTRIAGLYIAAVLAGFSAFGQTAKQDIKNAGTDTKDAVKSTGRATKKTATKVGHKTKHTVHKASQKVANKTSDK